MASWAAAPREREEENEPMATAHPGGASAAEKQQGKWWCNFCNLRTDDQEYYLSHSCQDELKKRGVEAPKDLGTHCR
jgi:hypothetical protein